MHLDWSALLILLLVVPGWLYLAGAALAVRRFCREPLPRPAERRPVTVLKPLYGDEPRLYENLLSFVRQDYPALQIVCGVRDAADRALPAALRLRDENPGCDISVVVDETARGSNLKVANLENMAARARHGILVMADSDMRVDPRYVAAVTGSLEAPGVGLVTCLYRGVSTGGLWSELGALHINAGFLPSAIVAERLGVADGCFGATIALTTAVLEKAGGFARIRDELADDHRLGAAVRQAGLKISLSRYLVDDMVSEPGFIALWRHELRWARTVRAMAPAGHAGSLVTHVVALSLLAAAVTGFTLTSCLILVISCLVRGASAGAILCALNVTRAPLRLLLLRDLLSFAVFAGSFMGRSVAWRDLAFSVSRDGRMAKGRAIPRRATDGDQAA